MAIICIKCGIPAITSIDGKCYECWQNDTCVSEIRNDPNHCDDCYIAYHMQKIFKTVKEIGGGSSRWFYKKLMHLNLAALKIEKLDKKFIEGEE